MNVLQNNWNAIIALRNEFIGTELIFFSCYPGDCAKYPCFVQVFAQFCSKIISMYFYASLHSLLLNLIKLFLLLTKDPTSFVSLSSWAVHPPGLAGWSSHLDLLSGLYVGGGASKGTKWKRRNRIHEHFAPLVIWVQRRMKSWLLLEGEWAPYIVIVWQWPKPLEPEQALCRTSLTCTSPETWLQKSCVTKGFGCQIKNKMATASLPNRKLQFV